MKRYIPLLLCGMLFAALPTAQATNTPSLYGGIQTDTEMLKDPSYWRNRTPYAHIPHFGLSLGMGFIPHYFAPANAEVSPYVSSALSFSLAMGLSQAGVTGYWSDLGLSVGWGLAKALTDNIGSSRYAREVYSRDVGLSLGKDLFVERTTGIRVGFGISFKIPASLSSWQKTLITSIGPGISISKSFLSRIHLSYSFGTNFNFYQQDSGLYHPELAGIPGLNQRWGMTHGFGLGITIVENFNLNLGLSIGTGYSFADAYASPDGPQVYGGEALSPAELASYPLNEGNFYGISIGLSYRLNRHLGFQIAYTNSGAQFEYQFDNNNNRQYVLRNPFKLQNGAFSFGISGSI